MSIIQAPKRIIVEDFNSEDRAVAERIANSVNIFMDEVFNSLNKGISVNDNLNQNIKTVKVIVDANGNPIFPIKFPNNLKTKLVGLQVIRSIGVLVKSTPFVDFTENAGIVTINNIQGLTENTEYQLVILTIGN